MDHSLGKKNHQEYDGEFISPLGKGAICGVEPDAARMSDDVTIPVQTHSCNVKVIASYGEIPSLEDTDAIICFRKGMKIGVRTADCVPVLLYAPDIDAVAAIHAGWKGSLGGIVDKVMDNLIDSGADPAVIKAAFGPSICAACYEVSEELSENFRTAGFEDAFISHRHISIEKVNTLRLIRRGVRPENIGAGRLCTKETPFLPSWRRCQTPLRLTTWVQLS